MVRWLKTFLGLFFVPKCIFCRRLLSPNTEVFVCDECKNLKRDSAKRKCALCDTPINVPYGDNFCLVCKSRKRYFKRVFAPLIYGGAVRGAVLRLKFSGKRAYAHTFARLIYDYIREEQPWLSPDVITFVPLSKTRLKMRGYNQAELIAKSLSGLFDAPCLPLIQKIRETPAQSGLKLPARTQNVRGAFSNNGEFPLSAKCVLLVDDVLTTGSTLNECAKVLIRGGAGSVYCAAAAVTEKR